jgi:hypothetical protein
MNTLAYFADAQIAREKSFVLNTLFSFDAVFDGVFGPTKPFSKWSNI